MKYIFKALPNIGKSFQYLCKTFHHMSEAKLREGVFVCPDKSKLNFEEEFLIMMTEFEREAWIALKYVVSTFLESNRQPD
jgi:hypothetical protein